jgi:hypothetical protein
MVSLAMTGFLEIGSGISSTLNVMVMSLGLSFLNYQFNSYIATGSVSEARLSKQEGPQG